METFDGHRALFRPLFNAAVALGTFDGVHLGHMALLKGAVAAAHQAGGDAVVYTFDPHPAQVLAPAMAPATLTPKHRKLELLAEAGIDVCIMEPFTREFAAMTAQEFLDGPLLSIVRPRHVIVGYDFTFGRDRRGNADTLRAFGRKHDIEVDVVEPVAINGTVASSTAIRTLIASGDMAAAKALLGRNFDVDGTVVRGAGRGREIGIPTANIDCGEVLLPSPGIYAVIFHILDEAEPRRLAGAASLGTNPTFVDTGVLSLEVHVLDFAADLYRRPVRVEFVEKIRLEERYDSVDALLAQIRADIDKTREILAAELKLGS